VLLPDPLRKALPRLPIAAIIMEPTSKGKGEKGKGVGRGRKRKGKGLVPP